MYTLYIANKNYSSWSLRPWVLLKERGISFEESQVVFSAGSNWDKFRKFCPSGLVPCLVDGEQTVWDSLAIAEYLAEKHPGVWPQDTKARTWARCAAAEMHSGFSALRNLCPMNCAIRVQLNEVSDALQQNVSRLDELLGEGLDRFGGPFLTGKEFTAVDAFYAPVAFRVQTYGLQLSKEVTAYFNRVLALPSIRDWQASAYKEPWLDEAHEEEAREVGTVTQDFRSI
jgi:glutathione S-transferase